MAKNTNTGDVVLIGSRLPNGLVLEHPLSPATTVTLKSRFTALGSGENVTFIDGGHSETEVPAEFWTAWSAVNAKFPAFVSGAIFEAKDSASLKAIAREREKVITGFEGAKPKESGVAEAVA